MSGLKMILRQQLRMQNGFTPYEVQYGCALLDDPLVTDAHIVEIMSEHSFRSIAKGGEFLNDIGFLKQLIATNKKLSAKDAKAWVVFGTRKVKVDGRMGMGCLDVKELAKRPAGLKALRNIYNTVPVARGQLESIFNPLKHSQRLRDIAEGRGNVEPGFTFRRSTPTAAGPCELTKLMEGKSGFIRHGLTRNLRNLGETEERLYNSQASKVDPLARREYLVYGPDHTPAYPPMFITPQAFFAQGGRQTAKQFERKAKRLTKRFLNQH